MKEPLPRCISLQPPTGKYNHIMLLGEAPGEKEEEEGLPFVGKAGKMLDLLCEEAGLLRGDCVITNVFHVRPPSNKVEFFFGPKEEGADPTGLGFPFREKLYLKAEYRGEMERLLGELKKWKPRVIVALGGTALWSLTGFNKISDFIGKSHPVQSHIVLGSWHPAFLLYSQAKMYRDQAVGVLKDAMEFADVAE